MSKKAHREEDLMNVESKKAIELKHGSWHSSNSQELWRMAEWDLPCRILGYSILSQKYESYWVWREYVINDFSRYLIRRLVPDDILNKIRKGERYIFQVEQVLEDVVEAPDPILNLATDLAIELLIHVIEDEFYFYCRKIKMTTRNNFEKRAVSEKVEATLTKKNMVGSGKIFERVVSIDVSKCKSEKGVQQELAAHLGLHTIHDLLKKITKQRYLLLLMDGDGDQNINPWEAGCCKSNSGVLMFITTESADARRKEYAAHANDEIEIRTEDHLLPWVVFCRNVGGDLVRSSSGIQKIALQIVEECRGHLNVEVMVARLLKNVRDVEIWEHTLQKLRSPHNYLEGMSRLMVNAFILFWESLDPKKRDCLKICLCDFNNEYVRQWYDYGIKHKWIFYGLLQTEEEVEDFLEELRSYSISVRESWQKIEFPEEIYETLESLNRSNLPVIITSNPHDDDTWCRAIVVDAKLLDLPQSPNCPQLREVLMNDNPDLTEIPQLFFQQMPELRALDLSQTSLRDLPCSVTNLAELKELKLHNCKLFMDLPLEIEQLKNLEQLHLDGTQIAYLPPSPKWSRLRKLFLQNNPHLKEIPQLFFQQMHELRWLDLSHTSLRKLPSSLINLAKLEELKLQNCKLFMDLPPEVEQLKNLEQLHLDGTQIAYLPPSPKWSQLRGFFFQNNPHLSELPPLFFDNMPLLRVLNLSSTSIKELPHSFFKLVNLRSFYLRDCDLFKKLPLEIRALGCISHLDLNGTFLLHLPKVVKYLENLERLNLCFYGLPLGIGGGKDNMQFSRSTIIPAGVISNLKSLYFLSIRVNADDKRWLENVEIILPEILGLRKLRVLELYIPRVELLGQMSICISRLRIFKFIVGHRMQQRIISRAPPALATKFSEGLKCLTFVNGMDIPQEINDTLKYCDTFFLDRHVTIEDLTAFRLENFDLLRVCALGECNKMQTIVDGRNLCSRYTLSKLEILVVFYMQNLKTIVKGNGVTSALCFSRLKTLELHNCPKLKTVFTLDFVGNFHFLEEIIIEDCPKVSTLISHESFEQEETLFLPKLRKVLFLYLPKLVTVSGGLHIGPKLEKIGFYYCPKLKSLSMMELSSNDLKVIKGETRWWRRLTWSQEGWKQSQVDHLKKIFSQINEDRDIMTQLTTEEDDIVKQDDNDAKDNIGDDYDYDDLDDDDSKDNDEDDDE